MISDLGGGLALGKLLPGPSLVSALVQRLGITLLKPQTRAVLGGVKFLGRRLHLRITVLVIGPYLLDRVRAVPT